VLALARFFIGQVGLICPLIMKKDVFCFLIDDDADDRDIFAMALEQIDPSIKFEYAMSGKEGIEKLKEKKGHFLPDYIFLDLNMQIMDGKECLQELKKIAHVADIPVIIYSTTLNENVIYDTLQMGAFDHIEKPSKLGTLKYYLNRVISPLLTA
jgi:CheY-like chemotaxis protein